MIYVERKDWAGRWLPMLIHGEPPEKAKFRNPPVDVPECMSGFSLDVIREFLSPDGKLFGEPRNEQIARALAGGADVVWYEVDERL